MWKNTTMGDMEHRDVREEKESDQRADTEDQCVE